MNILIAGAHGQLGCELQKILREGRAEIGALSPRYEGAHVVATDCTQLDITSEDAVCGFVQRHSFDLIINCAAMTDVDACESHKEAAYLVNAVGPRNLACAASAAGAKFVQVSTDYVFSGDERRPRTETDPCNPQTVYGATKRAGEQFVADSCEKYFIVRTAWLYGLTGNNFVKTMMKLAQENAEIKVVNDQWGNPTNANDLAYEILKIALSKNYGIYHATNNGICTWYDFAQAIVDEAAIECVRTPCTTEEFPRPAKRPAYSALDNKRLRETVGDEMRPWREALNAYVGCCKNSLGE
ncbi:MAG: dTDP-4-dehydrorhamnose reductase [Raoultibacter sp.]